MSGPRGKLPSPVNFPAHGFVHTTVPPAPEAMTERHDADTDALRLRFTVLRCQAGDEEAFVRLHAWFAPRTFAHLRSLVGDDADDVQQEVWLTVYRQVARLADPGAFRTWLFRTTRHRAIDWLRRRRREGEVIVEGLEGVGLEVASDAGDDAEAALDLAALGELIAELPPLQREALQLRYGDGLSYAEIALVTGCPVGTVRSRLHNGRRLLEQLYMARGRNGPDGSREGGTT